MGMLLGLLEVVPGGLPDHLYTQVLEVSCLVQGLQYKISAIVKVEDQRTGVYACNKYAK